jgi:hypothetical protein
MKMIALFGQFIVIVFMLQFGMYLLDVPKAFDFRESVLYFLGLMSIMLSADIGGRVYRAILGSRGKG